MMLNDELQCISEGRDAANSSASINSGPQTVHSGKDGNEEESNCDVQNGNDDESIAEDIEIGISNNDSTSQHDDESSSNASVQKSSSVEINNNDKSVSSDINDNGSCTNDSANDIHVDNGDVLSGISENDHVISTTDASIKSNENESQKDVGKNDNDDNTRDDANEKNDENGSFLDESLLKSDSKNSFTGDKSINVDNGDVNIGNAETGADSDSDNIKEIVSDEDNLSLLADIGNGENANECFTSERNIVDTIFSDDSSADVANENNESSDTSERDIVDTIFSDDASEDAANDSQNNESTSGGKKYILIAIIVFIVISATSTTAVLMFLPTAPDREPKSQEIVIASNINDPDNSTQVSSSIKTPLPSYLATKAPVIPISPPSQIPSFVPTQISIETMIPSILSSRSPTISLVSQHTDAGSYDDNATLSKSVSPSVKNSYIQANDDWTTTPTDESMLTSPPSIRANTSSPGPTIAPAEQVLDPTMISLNISSSPTNNLISIYPSEQGSYIQANYSSLMPLDTLMPTYNSSELMWNTTKPLPNVSSPSPTISLYPIMDDDIYNTFVSISPSEQVSQANNSGTAFNGTFVPTSSPSESPSERALNTTAAPLNVSSPSPTVSLFDFMNDIYNSSLSMSPSEQASYIQANYSSLLPMDTLIPTSSPSERVLNTTSNPSNVSSPSPTVSMFDFTGISSNDTFVPTSSPSERVLNTAAAPSNVSSPSPTISSFSFTDDDSHDVFLSMSPSEQPSQANNSAISSNDTFVPTSSPSERALNTTTAPLNVSSPSPIISLFAFTDDDSYNSSLSITPSSQASYIQANYSSLLPMDTLIPTSSLSEQALNMSKVLNASLSDHNLNHSSSFPLISSPDIFERASYNQVNKHPSGLPSSRPPDDSSSSPSFLATKFMESFKHHLVHELPHFTEKDKDDYHLIHPSSFPSLSSPDTLSSSQSFLPTTFKEELDNNFVHQLPHFTKKVKDS